MRIPVAVVAIALVWCGCSSGVPTRATDISDTGATLNGRVFSFQRDTDVQYWFKYGTTTAYGLSTAEHTVHIPAQQTESEPVSAPVSGLTPFTTYHFQLCTAPPRGGCLNADKAFTAGPGLVFVTERPMVSGIWSMDAGGHDEVRLTQLLGGEANPSVSPDGSKIAFASNFDGFSIWVMDVDGGNQHPITAGSFSDHPAWSPDGKKIAFLSNRDGDSEIYVTDPDGGNATRLTNSPGLDTEPTWSPDGTKIAFSSGRAGAGTRQIYSIEADGDNPTRLSDGSGEDVQPDWSPDGTKIAFSHDIPNPSPGGIWVMDADGGNPTSLTDDAGSSDYAPAWSPDGTRIAFTRSHDIYSMHADGTQQTQLTNSRFLEWLPDWIPRP